MNQSRDDNVSFFAGTRNVQNNYQRLATTSGCTKIQNTHNGDVAVEGFGS